MRTRAIAQKVGSCRIRLELIEGMLNDEKDGLVASGLVGVIPQRELPILTPNLGTVAEVVSDTFERKGRQERNLVLVTGMPRTR